jgi:hypothetical protein
MKYLIVFILIVLTASNAFSGGQGTAAAPPPGSGLPVMQGARDATAQAWFVQDPAGGLNLQATQLVISTTMTSILAKMGNGTHIVDVSDLFTLDTTAVAGNAILTNLKTDQTSGLQKTQISNSLGQAVGVTGAPVVGTESGLITRPIFPEGANAIALESTQLSGNGTLTTINATLGTLGTSANQTNGLQKTQSIPVAATSVSVTSPTVTTLSSTILAANALRKGCLIVNVGSNTVRIRYDGAAASATADLFLYPSQTRDCALGAVPTAAITAIAETGTSVVSVTEVN